MLLFVLPLGITACGPGTAAATHSTTATASIAASIGSSPMPAAGQACKLPAVQWTQTAQGLEPTAGFIAIPEGQMHPDSSGAFVLEGSRYHSTAQPFLYGGGPGAGSYDWPMTRWLPASARLVSPDGSRYAYSTDFGFIHVVDVASGQDRTFKAPDGPETLMYYAREGIYFNHAWEGPPGPGLWLLDPATGAVQTVFNDKPVDAVGGFAAWLPDVNPADPHPVFDQHSGTYMPNRLLRRDLNGGSTVPWFYRPGRVLAVIGFDQDKHPLIVAETTTSPDSVEVWQVTAANQGHKLYSGTRVPSIAADGRGIWFADDQGISLYTAAEGLKKMSALSVDLAGVCR